MSARQWSRDLAMGARFAVTGGREAWVRVLLTAVGVGLGVALLLLTTALPSALDARHQRESARGYLMYSSTVEKKSDRTLLIATSDTTFRDEDVRGGWSNPRAPGRRCRRACRRSRLSATWSSRPPSTGC